MLLAIDVGNSQTVCGIFRKDSLFCFWRCSPSGFAPSGPQSFPAEGGRTLGQGAEVTDELAEARAVLGLGHELGLGLELVPPLPDVAYAD